MLDFVNDNIIEKIIRAANGDLTELDPLANVPAYELDPIARVTQETAAAAARIPAVFATQEDTSDEIDMMTVTPREKRVAEKTYQKQTPGSSGAFAAAQGATGLDKPTTGQFVRRLVAKEGLPYEYGSTGQPDPVSGKPAFDCSGIIYKVMQGFGFSNFPRVSHDIIDHSQPISIKKALKTRGAILYSKSAASPSGGHIAISLGNGKAIEARGEEYGVLIADARGRFTKGGLLPELAIGKAPQEAGKAKKNKGRLKRIAIEPDDPVNRAEPSSFTAPVAVFGKLMDELEAPTIRLPKQRKPSDAPPSTKGVKGQLYAGFIEAGRPDLAKMVFTKEFDKWIGAESGWRPGVVSPANNQGLANGGLFQFWFGHDWTSKYIKNGEFTASPYQQAILAARHFDLTPDDIRTYAHQIDRDEYVGWG